MSAQVSGGPSVQYSPPPVPGSPPPVPGTPPPILGQLVTTQPTSTGELLFSILKALILFLTFHFFAGSFSVSPASQISATTGVPTSTQQSGGPSVQKGLSSPPIPGTPPPVPDHFVTTQPNPNGRFHFLFLPSDNSNPFVWNYFS